MLRGAKNTVQGAKMAFGTPFLATPFGVALRAIFLVMASKCYVTIVKVYSNFEIVLLWV